MNQPADKEKRAHDCTEKWRAHELLQETGIGMMDANLGPLWGSLGTKTRSHSKWLFNSIQMVRGHINNVAWQPSGTLSETWAILVFDVNISWFIHETAYDRLNYDELWFQHNVHMVNRVRPRSSADDKINKQNDKRAAHRVCPQALSYSSAILFTWTWTYMNLQKL